MTEILQKNMYLLKETSLCAVRIVNVRLFDYVTTLV